MLKERGEVAPFVWVWDLQIIIFFFYKFTCAIPPVPSGGLFLPHFVVFNSRRLRAASRLPGFTGSSWEMPG